MINIDLYYNNQKQLCRFTLAGHAGYADHGQDIVCAAVSMIVFNTINSIDLLTKETLSLNQDEAKAYIDCSFPDISTNKGSKEASLLLKSMELGLKDIEKQYGEYIQINTKKDSSGGE